MITIDDILRAEKTKHIKPSDSEEDLRHLPYKNAFIYGRISSPKQVKEHYESVRAIALLVDIAKKDGYNTALTSAAVEDWLADIKNGKAEYDTREDGEVTIDIRDLRLSGRLNDRPGLDHLQQSIQDGHTGAVYVTEGVSRLSRDDDGITGPSLLKLFRKHNCRVRTRRKIFNPRIQHDRELLEEDFRDARKESKTMDIRLYQGRRDKAAEGKYVGGPVPPGFIVEILDTKPSGCRVYGKLQPYPPHAEIVMKILREYIKQGFSRMKTHHALNGLKYPLFSTDVEYMEHLSSLRKAMRTEDGYLISPAMIRLLALNVKLIGIWTWGDTELRRDNHDAIVPADLFLEAYEGAMKSGKPRGKGIIHEPLEWNHLFYCCNHDISVRISGHPAKGAYRCESDYVQGRGPTCFDIAAHYLDEPLTASVLRQLDFTSFSEEVLSQMEENYSHTNLEAEQRNKEVITLEKRLENLKLCLGYGDKKYDEDHCEQIDKTRLRLTELRSRPLPEKIVTVANYNLVRNFLNGLPEKWGTYSRTLRNRLLQLIIDHVDIRHDGQAIEATIHWKTGQSQVLSIRRARAKGNLKNRWTNPEIELLKMLWSDSSKEAIRVALPDRTWRAIADKAVQKKLKRTASQSRGSPRRHWELDDERDAKQLYESGASILDISMQLARTQSAILQYAWEKGWLRPQKDQRIATTDSFGINQKPEVSNGISSGIVLGGHVRVATGLGYLC